MVMSTVLFTVDASSAMASAAREALRATASSAADATLATALFAVDVTVAKFLGHGFLHREALASVKAQSL